MKNYQCFIFSTLLQLTLGAQISTWEGWTVLFPLPELPPETSIDSVEWKYHTIHKTILLGTINLMKKQQLRNFSKRTGMKIMENGTLYIEDVKDEDSGNYSCTIILHDRKMWIEQIYLEVLHAKEVTTEPNSKMYTTFKPSVPSITVTALIAISVCSALAILTTVATIFIFKCAKKCCHTSDEPIYANKMVIIEENKRSQVDRRTADNTTRLKR
ncbi:uncharacterized protein LOC113053760 [Carassius auratus]|uniref:Uncharacterized protein LOC113053760 n=1 Tax=Carassius auratus TaxID=7957 RepID=A0A6P6KTR3_CARAU|nr:uncharacterized protein LOC113053760 [Carassius auratus]